MDAHYPHDGEISLIDLLVTVAESWKLLVILPVLVGAVAFLGLWFGEGREYRSVALLRISTGQAAMLQTARVLDVPLRENGWIERYGPTLSSARENLLSRLTLSPVDGANFYRVSLIDETPEHAQRTLNSIINSLIVNSVPTEEDRQLAEMQLEGHRSALVELESHIEKIGRTYENGSAIALGEIGHSVVALLADIDKRRQAIAALELSLVSSVKQADILQWPSLADRPMPRNIASKVILFGFGAGFLTLIFVFVRQGLRNAAENPAESKKIARIRRAFWLKERPL